jgi:hypothetical protein
MNPSNALLSLSPRTSSGFTAHTLGAVQGNASGIPLNVLGFTPLK